MAFWVRRGEYLPENVDSNLASSCFALGSWRFVAAATAFPPSRAPLSSPLRVTRVHRQNIPVSIRKTTEFPDAAVRDSQRRALEVCRRA